MSMDYLEKARRVISLEVEELNQLIERIDESFARAVDCLKQTVERGGKVVILGVGKSGNIGNKLAATFNSTGAPATVMSCQDALHGDLGLIAAGDSVLVLSYSGETEEILQVLPHLKRRGVPLIAVTGKAASTLAKASDWVLDVRVSREACPLNLAPTSSTTCALAMGDALAMVLLESRGFTTERFAELHPGGSLGRALLWRARDIMRAGDDLVRVAPGLSIREVVALMTKARAGAVVVVADDGTLAGIFTQGDFARAFQSDRPDIGAQAVGDHMTPNPVSIRDEALVGEVLRVLEGHRIDDLIVLDAGTRPVGMIDIQDLTRLKVV